MIRDIARVLHDLRGAGARDLAGLLVGQIEAASRAVAILVEVCEGTRPVEAAHQPVVDCEHEGDRYHGLLVAELARVISTPIDREDIFRISRSVDDVLDNLRDLQRELGLYTPRDASALTPMLSAVGSALIELHGAIAAVGSTPAQITVRTRAAKKQATVIRRAYHAALAELFASELTMETLKVRELLRRLDVVGLRLNEAADALADAAIKRGG